MTIPEFSGRCADPEKYLEWEMRINQIFDGHNYSKEKKVRVASMEFTEYLYGGIIRTVLRSD